MAATTSSPRAESYRRPALALLAAEGPRAVGELGAMAAALPLLRRAPRGDGHPVLVLPGFGGGDNSTRPVRWFLRDLGYHVHGWRLGINLGPSDRVIDGLAARLAVLAERHGSPMSLIGWSLGGVYAREITRAVPDHIRQVITLGSPFRLTDGEDAYTGRLYNALAPFHSARAEERRLPEAERPRLRAPATAIYTRTDGIAPWRSCVDLPGERCESIEVRGSHSGLGHNPAALVIVADRLAQREGSWAPFRRSRYPLLAGMIPPPRSAR
jgi:pimeloyl-ACP methyl ester carboxylesterase